MSKSILGKKIGMTQVFTDSGEFIPVTVIEAGPCVVVQKKTVENDGYNAVQVGFQDIKEKLINKPLKGHFAKSKVDHKKYLREFRDDSLELNEGDTITVEQFSEGEKVDVTGISRGKGFAGTVKRWNFSRGPMTHGSHFHRAPGSIGSVDAARVFKGQKLPGRMGNQRKTIKNLEIVKVDKEKNLLLIKGSIPGAKKGLVIIKGAYKAS